MLRENETIPEWFSFPETVEELRRGIVRKQQQGAVVFFTGYSGAGKSTIASALAQEIDARFGRTVSLLDGDAVRLHLSRGLGFSKEDRDTNVERIGYVAAEIARHGGVAVCAAIAPYRASRERNRDFAARAGAEYFEIHVATPLSVCESRDTKGLYRKAKEGLLPNFTGVDDPYELPEAPSLVIDTSEASVEAAVAAILKLMKGAGVLE